MRKRTILLMILINVIWAGSYSATKSIMDHVPFYLITSIRYFIAAGPLLIITAAVYGLGMKPKDLLKCAIIGIATFTLCPVLMYKGVEISRAADAAILSSTEPLMVSLGAYIYLREKVSRRTAIALLTAFGGALLLSEFWKEAGAINPIGTFLIIGAVFFEAWYSVLGKELLKRHKPIKVTGIAISFGCVANAIALSFLGYWPKITALTPMDWFILAGYLAGICTLVGYTFWYVALKGNPASSVAVTIFIQPVVGITVAWLWVNETPTLFQIVGTIVILLSVIFAITGPPNKLKRADAV